MTKSNKSNPRPEYLQRLFGDDAVANAAEQQRHSDGRTTGPGDNAQEATKALGESRDGFSGKPTWEQRQENRDKMRDYMDRVRR